MLFSKFPISTPRIPLYVRPSLPLEHVFGGVSLVFRGVYLVFVGVYLLCIFFLDGVGWGGCIQYLYVYI